MNENFIKKYLKKVYEIHLFQILDCYLIFENIVGQFWLISAIKEKLNTFKVVHPKETYFHLPTSTLEPTINCQILSDRVNLENGFECLYSLFTFLTRTKMKQECLQFFFQCSVSLTSFHVKEFCFY